MKKILAILLYLWPALAQAQQGVSAPDPFVFTERVNFKGNNATSGLTARDGSFNPASRNLALIVAGQSNCTNINPTTFIPGSSSVIDQFSVYDSGSYAITTGLLGTGNNGLATPGGGLGNVGARLAQLFITNGIFDHVVVGSVCIGSTSAADWATGGEAQRIPVILKRMAARGITPGATGWTFAISWWQGENDGVGGTSPASYTSSLQTILADARAAGFTCTNCRFFVNVQTWNIGLVYPVIQTAQAALANSPPFYLGGNLDTLNASNRLADNVHFNDAGAAAAALLVYNAMHASGSPF